MRVGLVILPSDRWADARRQWEWADDVGFATGWTYDHIRWGGMPDGPWHGAVPVLAAAAGVTTRLRLGTLVATPNFRHPVTLGRDAIALDDLSGGRLDLGLGPGSEGPDAMVLGQEPWRPAERMARFEEFLRILSAMLTADGATSTSMRTEHYAAVEAPSTPGTVQRPLPLTVAASATTGLGLAAAYGHQWVTIGPGRGPRTPETILEAVRQQVEVLEVATQAAGRARAGSRPPLGTRRAGHHVGRPVRLPGGPVRRARLRPVRPAPSGSDRPLLRQRQSVRADRGEVRRRRTLTGCR